MRRWKAHRGKIASLSFSRDGQFLASVTGSGRDIFIWDATAGELVRKLTVENPRDAPAYIDAMAVCFSPDEPILAVVRRFYAEVWNTSDWTRVAESIFPSLIGVPYDVAVSTGPTPWIACARSSVIEVFEYSIEHNNFAIKKSLPIPNASQLSFSQNGQLLATHTQWSVTIWELPTGRGAQSYRHASTNYAGPVRFTPDSSRLAFCYKKTIESLPAKLDDSDAVIREIGGTDNRPGLFDDFEPDVTTAANIIRYAGHTDKVWMLRYTPDGRTLISASSDGTVRMWEASTGLEIRCFDTKIGKIAAADVSPDGAIAAVGGANGEIVVWDLE